MGRATGVACSTIGRGLKDLAAPERLPARAAGVRRAALAIDEYVAQGQNFQEAPFDSKRLVLNLECRNASGGGHIRLPRSTKAMDKPDEVLVGDNARVRRRGGTNLRNSATTISRWRLAALRTLIHFKARPSTVF